jgi:hypothetical protein
MSYIRGEDRGQAALLPAAIEDYVAADAPDFKTIADFHRDNSAAIVGACRAVCTENLNPHIMVMKPTENSV